MAKMHQIRPLCLAMCLVSNNTSYCFVFNLTFFPNLGNHLFNNYGYGTEYALYSQFGFSVQIPKNQEKYNIANFDKRDQFIVYGAPGFLLWTGAMFVIQTSKIFDQRKNFRYEYTLMSAYKQFTKRDPHSYFGYAVTSGEFMKNELSFVTSGPRSLKYSGEVVFLNSAWQNGNMVEVYRIKGPIYGEYFGYTLLADDFNNDGFDEIAVSAPWHKDSDFNDGCVYVYQNRAIKDRISFDGNPIVLKSRQSRSQFGISLAQIGDINQDGYNG